MTLKFPQEARLHLTRMHSTELRLSSRTHPSERDSLRTKSKCCRSPKVFATILPVRGATRYRVEQRPVPPARSGALGFSHLARAPGQNGFREEIRKRLWPNVIFVDFDHGLNSAMNRLCEAVGDSTESPRIERKSSPASPCVRRHENARMAGD